MFCWCKVCCWRKFGLVCNNFIDLGYKQTVVFESIRYIYVLKYKQTDLLPSHPSHFQQLYGLVILGVRKETTGTIQQLWSAHEAAACE